MNVLHIYPKSDDQVARYVSMLTTSLSHSIDMRAACDAESVGQVCREWTPTIIHQHGSVSPSVVAPLSALQPSPRWVITPHGQHPDLQRSYVVVARSPIEHDQLIQHHPRVETVRNPLITRTVTTGDCARQMLRIYLRVSHSDVLPLMNTDTRQLLPLLLKAAVSGDRRWVDADSLLAKKPSFDFPLLYIYAEQEGVLTLVEQGLRLLGIEAPRPEPAESYLPEGFKLPRPLLTEKADDTRDATSLSSMMVRMLRDVQQNGPTLLRLTEIARTLRHDQLDEAALLKELEQQGLSDFLPCLLPLLAEQTGLTEGFMPCQPVDNKTTASLRTKLEQHFRLKNTI